ncbi:hypothetical protein N9L31_00200 [bacterium]|nr:hypothetical protein [bacterium]
MPAQHDDHADGQRRVLRVREQRPNLRPDLRDLGLCVHTRRALLLVLHAARLWSGNTFQRVLDATQRDFLEPYALKTALFMDLAHLANSVDVFFVTKLNRSCKPLATQPRALLEPRCELCWRSTHHSSCAQERHECTHNEPCDSHFS